MEALGIPRLYDDGPVRPHRWDSGWVEGALAALDAMSRPGARPGATRRDVHSG